MRPAKATTRRRTWLFVVSTAVLLQSLYADGFMPGSFAGGWPVMLCPDGLPAGFISSGHDGHHQHDDSSGGSQASDSCPLGKAFASQATMPSSIFVASPFYTAPETVNTPNQPALRHRRDSFFHSRAPPVPVFV